MTCTNVQTSLELFALLTTGNNAAQTSSRDSALAQEPMDLSHVCIQDVKDRIVYTNATVVAVVSPDCKAVNSGRPDCASYSELLDLHREFAQIHPESHVNVINTSIDMDEGSGRARVFMLVGILDQLADRRGGAVVLWKWRKRFGTWMLFRQDGVRGICGVFKDGYIQQKEKSVDD